MSLFPPLDPGPARTATAPDRAPVAGPRPRLRRHPAHAIAVGLGSGLAPKAPGTVGTLWAWASFLVLDLWLSPAGWGVLIALSLAVGWWACTVTARDTGIADPGFIVWDEIVAFWIVLWLLMPAGFWWQLAAFGLFRFFDAAKPGPVGWTDRRFKGGGWRGGFGILADDLVAAGCTLFVLALAVRVWGR
jgi:phosphatidylglycerophosphatase A